MFSSTDTVFEPSFATIRSGLPSPLMSAAVTDNGSVPVAKVCWAAKRGGGGPGRRRVQQHRHRVRLVLATIRSGMPSPFMSAAATDSDRCRWRRFAGRRTRCRGPGHRRVQQHRYRVREVIRGDQVRHAITVYVRYRDGGWTGAGGEGLLVGKCDRRARGVGDPGQLHREGQARVVVGPVVEDRDADGRRRRTGGDRHRPGGWREVSDRLSRAGHRGVADRDRAVRSPVRVTVKSMSTVPPGIGSMAVVLAIERKAAGARRYSSSSRSSAYGFPVRDRAAGPAFGSRHEAFLGWRDRRNLYSYNESVGRVMIRTSMPPGKVDTYFRATPKDPLAHRQSTIVESHRS